MKRIERIYGNRWAKVVIPIVIALISIFVLSKMAVSPAFHAKTIEALDAKNADVMKLTAASTSISAAITLIPGDVGLPIAERLMDLSSWFILVICAIYIEKYLLIITGFITFVIFIPVSCVLYIANLFFKNPVFHTIIKKLITLGIASFLAVPMSVQISNMIENTYNYSVENTVASTSEITESLEEEAKSFRISDMIANVKNGISGAVDKATTMMNQMIEYLAVMIVTSCVIPLSVLLFFIWLVRMVCNVNISLPNVKKLKISHYTSAKKFYSPKNRDM